MILPAGGGGVAGALRAADVDPMKELVDKDVVAADSQPLVSADINPRIFLLEVNPRNCSLVIPRYSYRQSYCSHFFDYSYCY